MYLKYIGCDPEKGVDTLLQQCILGYIRCKNVEEFDAF